MVQGYGRVVLWYLAFLMMWSGWSSRLDVFSITMKCH